MHRIDTRGMACPQPVLMTRNAIKDHPEGCEIIADNVTARGNVERFLKSAGYTCDVTEAEGDYILKAHR